MASIPNAGFPNFSAVKYGKGRKLPNQNGYVAQFFGFDQLEEALGAAMIASPMACQAAIKELGLFFERETKLHTPVHYGVLRASIGHFDPAQIHGLDPNGPKPSADLAVFKEESTATTFSVTVGTNVEYAPWIEWGFTMRTRRAVYFPGVGFRMVSPFSYRGAHMFELGLQKTVEAGDKILMFWAHEALTKVGLKTL